MTHGRHLPFQHHRRDDDYTTKVFDLRHGGGLVTAVKMFRRPVRLLLSSADDGLLATLTLRPREGGGCDLELRAEPGRTFDMQGLGFETAAFAIVEGPGGQGPLAEDAPRPLDMGALTAVEDVAAGGAHS